MGTNQRHHDPCRRIHDIIQGWEIPAEIGVRAGRRIDERGRPAKKAAAVAVFSEDRVTDRVIGCIAAVRSITQPIRPEIQLQGFRPKNGQDRAWMHIRDQIDSTLRQLPLRIKPGVRRNLAWIAGALEVAPLAEMRRAEAAELASRIRSRLASQSLF